MVITVAETKEGLNHTRPGLLILTPNLERGPQGGMALDQPFRSPLQGWNNQITPKPPHRWQVIRPQLRLQLMQKPQPHRGLRVWGGLQGGGLQAIQLQWVTAGNRRTGMSVGKWHKRYLDLGLEGLHDELRSDRPRTNENDQAAEVINRALQTKPTDGSTHWSARSLSIAKGISKSTVHRWLQTFSVQPHRQKSVKLSTDPFFVGKVRDIVGLYLNPPDNTVVLCVDEKTQVQALDRTQPLLSMGLGYVEGVTHDYIRHGTTTLFAALDVATGAVIAECKPRHRHQEFLSFLRRIDKEVPKELELHLIVDNYCTHKHALDRMSSAQR